MRSQIERQVLQHLRTQCLGQDLCMCAYASSREWLQSGCRVVAKWLQLCRQQAYADFSNNVYETSCSLYC